MKARGELSAIFRFNEYGLLKAIYLNSQNERDQEILLAGLRLLRSDKNLVKKISSKGGLYEG